MAPITSIQTDVDSIVSTNPSTSSSLFDMENPSHTTISQVTVTNINEESSLNLETDIFNSSSDYDPSHPFLEPSTYQQWSISSFTPCYAYVHMLPLFSLIAGLVLIA